MKTDLLRRVERMEQKASTNEDKVVWFVRANSPGEPVPGWTFNSGTEQIEILRHKGETDEELDTRTAAEARKYLGEDRIPFFISVNDLKCL